MEDVRLKLEEHRIRDEMRSNDDLLRDDDLDTLESELLRKTENLKLGQSPTLANNTNSFSRSRVSILYSS